MTTTCEKVSLTNGLKLSMHNDEIIFQQNQYNGENIIRRDNLESIM